MKYIIASDIHGDAVCCRALLDAAQKEGADKILLLGDILYHGPRNNLPCGYAPKQVNRNVKCKFQQNNMRARKLRRGGGSDGIILPHHVGL